MTGLRLKCGCSVRESPRSNAKWLVLQLTWCSTHRLVYVDITNPQPVAQADRAKARPRAPMAKLVPHVVPTEPDKYEEGENG